VKAVDTGADGLTSGRFNEWCEPISKCRLSCAIDTVYRNSVRPESLLTAAAISSGNMDPECISNLFSFIDSHEPLYAGSDVARFAKPAGVLNRTVKSVRFNAARMRRFHTEIHPN